MLETEGRKAEKKAMKPTEKSPHALLQNAAQYLAEQFTRTASFRSRGVLMPWQHEALAIVEARRKETI